MWSDKSNLARWGWFHRISGRARSASVVVALTVASASGCARAEKVEDGARVVALPTTPPAAPPLDSEGREAEARATAWLAPGAAVPARAVLIDLARELAASSSRLGRTSRALVLGRLAADLKTRAWRTSHVDSDAKDALDSYTAVAQGALAQGLFEPACDALVHRALLGGESTRDPERAYRELFVASRLFDKASCRDSIDRALATLSPYRPVRAILDGLAEQAEKDRAQALAMQRAAPAAVDPADESGVVVLAPPPGPLPTARVRVLSIDSYASKDRARIVVTLSGPTIFRVGDMPGPHLFLELERTEPSSRRLTSPGGLVEHVRQAGVLLGVGRSMAPSPDEGTRITLDLNAKVHRRIFYLPEPFRVVIDLATHDPPPSLGPPGARRPVTRVAIDAGHGGVDPGAIGPSGLREKDVTLDIAHLVAPMLSNELGIVTMLTRDDDRLVPLDERAARANAFHADLFLSIHCNASENTAAHGTMSFVLDATHDESAARLAARENAISVAAQSQVASIASRLRLSDLGARSTHLGELLQHATVASLGGAFGDPNDQGVKTAGFLVLVGAEMPSVLFETAFISNATEEKRLASPDYRRRLALALANAVRAYRDGL